MKTHVPATFVDGQFKPDESVSLADGTRVNLTIEPLAEQQPDSVAAWESIKARLRERPIHGGGKRFTRDELHERR